MIFKKSSPESTSVDRMSPVVLLFDKFGKHKADALVRYINDRDFATKADLEQMESRLNHRIDMSGKDLLIRLGSLIVVCSTIAVSVLGFIITLK